MPDDIRIQTDYPNRPSIKKLIRKLGPQGFQSWVFAELVVRSRCPDGDTSAWIAVDWALAGDWPGDPNDFVGGLVEAGLLIRAKDAEEFGIFDRCMSDGWVPIDWRNEQLYAIQHDERMDFARRGGIASGVARRAKTGKQKTLDFPVSSGNTSTRTGSSVSGEPVQTSSPSTPRTGSNSLLSLPPSTPSVPTTPSHPSDAMGDVGRAYERIMGCLLGGELSHVVVEWIARGKSPRLVVDCLEEANRAVDAHEARNLVSVWKQLVENTKAGDLPRWVGNTKRGGTESGASIARLGKKLEQEGS